MGRKYYYYPKTLKHKKCDHTTIWNYVRICKETKKSRDKSSNTLFYSVVTILITINDA